MKKNKRKPRTNGKARVPNDPLLDQDTPDEDILIGDQIDPKDDSDYPVGPDELSFIPSFWKEKTNHLIC